MRSMTGSSDLGVEFERARDAAAARASAAALSPSSDAVEPQLRVMIPIFHGMPPRQPPWRGRPASL